MPRGGGDHHDKHDNHVVGSVADLASLSSLTEQSLVEEISARYRHDDIYTYIGDVLCAVNPFKRLGRYGPSTSRQYRDALRSALPPHVYAIADSCYFNLKRRKENQCCIISGESGAGKTESAKFVMKHIIELCHRVGKDGSILGGLHIEEKILEVTPLLEAFGNAKTSLNDNSSRFGKYTQLVFNNHGHVLGARLSEYLLEKSRVFQQADGERNFHVFYYLFAAEDKADFGLTNPGDFDVLRGDLWDNNGDMYDELEQAMEDVGFHEDGQKFIRSSLAAILHLGNLHFEASDEATIKEDSEGTLGLSADLLGVEKELLRDAMSGQNMTTNGENYRKVFSPDQAYDCRDAIMTTLYGRLFGWIVAFVNEMLTPGLRAETMRRQKMGEEPERYEIGILDIFGFEHFERNGFEQFCINMANEQLQSYFNQHIFGLELLEYASEGVDGSSVDFLDNRDLLDMFLQPDGLLSTLDDQSVFPKATAQTLVDKFSEKFRSHAGFKNARGRSPNFIIIHYPGKVVYSTEDWLEKNRDNLSSDCLEMLESSKTSYLRDIIGGHINSSGQLIINKSEEGNDRGVSNRKKDSGHHHARGRKKSVFHERNPTLASQFKNSLNVLIQRMSTCFPHFIRCIKPNDQKLPGKFDRPSVMKQLRYTGMLETTRIRREGYAWRPSYVDFVRRYKIIAFDYKSNPTPSAENCEKILNAARVDNYALGKTKVFLKYYHMEALDQLVETYLGAAEKMVRAAAVYLACKRLKKLRANAKLQKNTTRFFCTYLKQQGERFDSNNASLKGQDEKRHQHMMREREIAVAEAKRLEDERRKFQEEKQKQDKKKKKVQFTESELERLPESSIRNERTSSVMGYKNKVNNDNVLHSDHIRRSSVPDVNGAAAGALTQDKLKSHREGQIYDWYRKSERRKGAGVDEKGQFKSWFHGIISRERAESQLFRKPVGCFMVRVSESRFGYALSFAGRRRVKHYIIEQDQRGRYAIMGVKYIAGSLNQLVEHFCNYPVDEEGHTLTIPCGQDNELEPDYAPLLKRQSKGRSVASPGDTDTVMSLSPKTPAARAQHWASDQHANISSKESPSVFFEPRHEVVADKSPLSPPHAEIRNQRSRMSQIIPNL